MKSKKTIFLSLSVYVLLFCGCSGNEAKKYQEAMQSNSISQIDKYLRKFPKAPQEHVVTP